MLCFCDYPGLMTSQETQRCTWIGISIQSSCSVGSSFFYLFPQYLLWDLTEHSIEADNNNSLFHIGRLENLTSSPDKYTGRCPTTLHKDMQHQTHTLRKKSKAKRLVSLRATPTVPSNNPSNTIFSLSSFLSHLQRLLLISDITQVGKLYRPNQRSNVYPILPLYPLLYPIGLQNVK